MKTYNETRNDLKEQIHLALRDEKKVTLLIEAHSGQCWYICEDVTFYNKFDAFTYVDNFDFGGNNIYIK